jgi:hypothetical protein
MPTYKNETNGVIVFGGVKWNPGEERAVNIYVPYSTLGLTKTSDSPSVASPVLYCQAVTLEAGVPQTIEVPWGADYISISAHVESGQTATMTIGDTGPNIIINDAAGKYISPQGGFKWTKASKITLSSDAGATVYLLVEGV